MTVVELHILDLMLGIVDVVIIVLAAAAPLAARELCRLGRANPARTARFPTTHTTYAMSTTQ